MKIGENHIQLGNLHPYFLHGRYDVRDLDKHAEEDGSLIFWTRLEICNDARIAP